MLFRSNRCSLLLPRLLSVLKFMLALKQHPLEIIILLKFLFTNSFPNIFIVYSFFQENFVDDACLVHFHNGGNCMLRNFPLFSGLLNVINRDNFLLFNASHSFDDFFSILDFANSVFILNSKLQRKFVHFFGKLLLF